MNSYIDLSNGGRGWDGIDNVPVMETVDGVTYAYVLYDGYSSYGGQLAKINCSPAAVTTARRAGSFGDLRGGC